MIQRLIQLTVCTLLVLLISISTSFAETTIKLQPQELSHPKFGKVSVQVPHGYELQLLDAKLSRPRMIEFASTGEMFIGSPRRVYLLRPPYTIAQTYIRINDYPHSVAIRENEMFIATTGGLYKAPYDPSANNIPKQQLELVAKLPGGFGHSSRTVGVGPDGLVYVSLGISGNCSYQMISNDFEFYDRRGGVLVLDESTSRAKLIPFASGLRNPVGFDWHPTTQMMYASNNGPDHLGFENPPEYFSKLTPDSFHGMPWFQYDGQKIRRDPCMKADPPFPKEKVQLPVATFPSRNAPLGVAFVPTGAMDETIEHNAVVALHGSWATQPDGLFTGEKETRRAPAVVMVRFKHGEATGVESLVTGFQDEKGERWARPAGVSVGPDGWLYITSDGGEFEGLMRLQKMNR